MFRAFLMVFFYSVLGFSTKIHRHEDLEKISYTETSSYGMFDAVIIVSLDKKNQEYCSEKTVMKISEDEICFDDYQHHYGQKAQVIFENLENKYKEQNQEVYFYENQRNCKNARN